MKYASDEIKRDSKFVSEAARHGAKVLEHAAEETVSKLMSLPERFSLEHDRVLKKSYEKSTSCWEDLEMIAFTFVTLIKKLGVTMVVTASTTVVLVIGIVILCACPKRKDT